MAMGLREQRILLNAGFRIFRLDLKQILGAQTIRTTRRPGSWSVYSKHESQAACKRAWNELMKDEKNLEG